MRLLPKIWLFLGKKYCAPLCALSGQIRCAFEFRIINHSGQDSVGSLKLKSRDKIVSIFKLYYFCKSEYVSFVFDVENPKENPGRPTSVSVGVDSNIRNPTI